ncbi:MAG: agmatine deiminase family protein, partial [Deltaproteobacteria bacterium]|nr:agmatine deiminase family protein [Deltaproteobacteria bacterium]
MMSRRARPGMPPGMLPRFKTAAERAADARRRTPGAMVLFDQFSDFRAQHIGSYFTTRGPGSATRMPAEYEPSQAWLITWNASMGTGDPFMIDQIRAGWGVAPLILATSDAGHRAWLEQKLRGAGLDPTDTAKVSFVTTPMDSIWARDFGPLSIVGVSAMGGPPTLAFVDFRYYHERVLDDQIPTALAKAWGINVYRPDMEFEGGNFMNTGEGLCAASKGVLWANPQLVQSAVEQIYADYLGCKVTVFPTPLEGEGTGHIDMFAKFSSDTTVLVGRYATAQDSQNAKILNDNAALFGKTKTPSG